MLCVICINLFVVLVRSLVCLIIIANKRNNRTMLMGEQANINYLFACKRNDYVTVYVQ